MTLRRILTAREQVELLAPWRTAMSDIYEEYAGHHQAPGPGTGFPIHQMEGNDDLGGVPDDWFTHPQYYTHDEVSRPEMRRVQNLYNQVRGNPEAPVDIYRALPHGNDTINTGDWVTPSLEYARQHAMHATDPAQDWPVVKTTVPAKHLWQNADSYYEMGYHGPGGQAKQAAKTRGVVQMPIDLAKSFTRFNPYENETYPDGRPVEEDQLQYARDYMDKMRNTLESPESWEAFRNVPALTVGSGGHHAVVEDGNHRVWAADAAGMTHVPMAITTHEDPAWAKQYGHRVTPELRSFLKQNLTAARTAGLEENDPLWDLLGLGPGGKSRIPDYQPPPPKPPADPVEGVVPGWEDYYHHLKGQEDRTHTAHAWLPTDVVDHYREYDRDPADANYQTVKKVIGEDGVKLPLWISANDTHGLLVEGNNRLAAAKELGIPSLPVRFTRDNPVMSNEGNAPIPHHPAVADWLAQNSQKISKRGGIVTAREQYEMQAPWRMASEMNMTRQVNKANQRAQDARRAGDHDRADYLEHLRDLMVQRHSEGHQRGWSDYEPMADEEFGEREASMAPVTLYTKPDCPQCDMTKKRLDAHEIAHQVVDLTTDPEAYAHVTQNLGYSSAPVVDAGGGNHWSGFRPDRIKALLG